MADGLRINYYNPVCATVSARKVGHTEFDQTVDQSEHAGSLWTTHKTQTPKNRKNYVSAWKWVQNYSAYTHNINS